MTEDEKRTAYVGVYTTEGVKAIMESEAARTETTISDIGHRALVKGLGKATASQVMRVKRGRRTAPRVRLHNGFRSVILAAGKTKTALARMAGIENPEAFSAIFREPLVYSKRMSGQLRQLATVLKYDGPLIDDQETAA